MVVINPNAPGVETRGGRMRRLGAPAALIVCALAGCAGDRSWFSNKPDDKPARQAPADSMVLRGDKLVQETAPAEGSANNKLATAHELYRNGEYEKAARAFFKIADNTKNPANIAEEARYYEAECYRRQAMYPKAADTYNRMLKDFPHGVYRDQGVQHMFEIANYWLDDTRKEMKQYKDAKEGKKSFVWPGPFCHWEKTKPFLDQEGRAVEKLEQVNLNCIGTNDKLAEQTLFMLGSIKFYREDYKEADYFFSQLVEMHPNSAYAPKALELAIISKHMSTGGPDYDGRKCAEARELIQVAKRNYHEFADEKSAFMDRQVAGITRQQAEKDFRIAEFYRRTGHPGAAYFYYEVVRRRYPGTPYFDQATERMHELKRKMEKKQKRTGKSDELKTPEEQPHEELAPPPQHLPALPKDVPSGPPAEAAPPPQALPPVPKTPPVTPPPMTGGVPSRGPTGNPQ
jgi:TolA-binding protein